MTSELNSAKYITYLYSFLYKVAFLVMLTALIHGETGAQTLTIKGSVRDSLPTQPLKGAVVMVIKLNDSTLTQFTRTDAQGVFRVDSLPVDTYQVIISHPFYGDQTVFILASDSNNVFDMPGVTLPPKSVMLNEVTILGYADPVYYKGDTIIYTADSFKVKKNAVVEDLLKKLPGIKVDNQGKIFSQGQAVDQVLVDGDEFFGTDPTTASKNLPASSVESVQVYDKKNDAADETKDKETLKIMDLKLKEDAKKGYFGKLSVATDFTKFYEGEVLANNFRGKQKISFFLLGSNTPRTSLNWNDIYQYGLNSSMEMQTSDEGYNYYSGEDYSGQRTLGIPHTFKTGFYYTDAIGKKTKVSFNYTYKKTSLFTESSTLSQYFLPDTAYKTNEPEREDKMDESHALNGIVTYTVDSLTELTLRTKLKSGNYNRSSSRNTTFMTTNDMYLRSTNTMNFTDGSNYDWDNQLKLTRNFKRKDRKLMVMYGIKTTTDKSNGSLAWNDHSYVNVSEPDSSTDQKKTTASNNLVHTANVTYTEPLSKKIKLEFAYDFSLSTGKQDKKTTDLVNGNYDTENPVFTNNFESERSINRFGAKFMYEIKKQSIYIGTRIRQVEATNTNMETLEKISQTVNNVLPYASYRYKFNDNQNISLSYSTSSRQPSLTQLQPVPDNSNPNYLVIGNPDLLPTFTNTFSLHAYSYKPVSGRNWWGYLTYSATKDGFSNNTYYDSIGRNISQPVNVKGNYYAYGSLSGQFPFFSRSLELSPYINTNLSQSTGYINGEKNVAKEVTPSLGFEMETHPDSILQVDFGFDYTYSRSLSSLSTASNKSYYTTMYKAGFNLDLPWKMNLETEAKYYDNNKLEQGYNLQYLIWDASLGKKFLKNENLTISIDATDLLDQNISTERHVNDNVISDVKTNVVGRYVLLKAVFRFNSDHQKKEDYE